MWVQIKESLVGVDQTLYTVLMFVNFGITATTTPEKGEKDRQK